MSADSLLGKLLVEFPAKMGALVLCGILRGFVFTRMWLWFMVPLGFSPMRVIPMIGVSLFCYALVGAHDITAYVAARTPDAKDPSFLQVILSNVIISLMIWLGAWFWHLFL